MLFLELTELLSDNFPVLLEVGDDPGVGVVPKDTVCLAPGETDICRCRTSVKMLIGWAISHAVDGIAPTSDRHFKDFAHSVKWPVGGDSNNRRSLSKTDV